MRPFALLGLLLTLTACGNPADGLPGFIGDTVTFRTNPNRPQPESDTVRRAMGMKVDSAPVLPAPGNIWPEVPKSEPVLSDVTPATRPMPTAMPTATPAPAAAPAAPAAAMAAPPVRSLATPQGNAVLETGANGMISYSLPSGATGRAIDNGNGTMTLIGTDGQVMTVPAGR